MIDYLLSSVALYRAFQDAGIWMIQGEDLAIYLESFLLSKV